MEKVRSGQYRSTKLVGTEETTRMAQREGASGSGTLTSATWQAAKTGGGAGVLIGAGIEYSKAYQTS